MGSSERQLTYTQVKAMNLVQYLAELGHQPKRVKVHDHWYLSPLRNERTASFKVNSSINRWYDFGTGQGGNLIDFGLCYFNCTIKEFLEGFQSILPAIPAVQGSKIKPAPKIVITQVKPLYAPSLIRYLCGIGISFELANRYCSQIHYQLNGKLKKDYGKEKADVIINTYRDLRDCSSEWVSVLVLLYFQLKFETYDHTVVAINVTILNTGLGITSRRILIEITNNATSGSSFFLG